MEKKSDLTTQNSNSIKKLKNYWDFMNKIEVRSNTEFSQPYCACLQKWSFAQHQTGFKENAKDKEEKKRNLMYLHDR